MAETKLKLIKAEAKGEEQQTASRIPALTPAERAEAARFRALTTTKAARQAKLRRMMTKLQDLDEVSPAA